MLTTKRKLTKSKNKKPSPTKAKATRTKRKKVSSKLEILNTAASSAAKSRGKAAVKAKAPVERTPNIDPQSRRKTPSGKAPGHRKIRLKKNFDSPTGSKVKIQNSAVDQISAEERVKRSVGVKINSK